MKRRDSLRDEAMFRVGTAMLGMFAGAAIGVLAFLPLAGVDAVALPFASFIAAAALSGMLCGALVPYVAAAAFEGVIHFVVGVFAAIAGEGWSASEDTPRWLRAAFWLGLFYAVGVWLFLEIVAATVAPG